MHPVAGCAEQRGEMAAGRLTPHPDPIRIEVVDVSFPPQEPEPRR
jgi:hypothetical protein